MRKIELNLVESVVYPDVSFWQVRVWHNENQSTVMEFTKDELQELHILTTDAFIEAYGTVTHSR